MGIRLVGRAALLPFAACVRHQVDAEAQKFAVHQLELDSFAIATSALALEDTRAPLEPSTLPGSSLLSDATASVERALGGGPAASLPECDGEEVAECKACAVKCGRCYHIQHASSGGVICTRELFGFGTKCISTAYSFTLKQCRKPIAVIPRRSTIRKAAALASLVGPGSADDHLRLMSDSSYHYMILFSVAAVVLLGGSCCCACLVYRLSSRSQDGEGPAEQLTKGEDQPTAEGEQPKEADAPGEGEPLQGDQAEKSAPASRPQLLSQDSKVVLDLTEARKVAAATLSSEVAVVAEAPGDGGEAEDSEEEGLDLTAHRSEAPASMPKVSTKKGTQEA